MIVYAPTPHGAAPSVATAVAENSMTARTFQTGASGTPPIEPIVMGEAGDSAETRFEPTDVRPEFDWDDPKTKREFIRLEQKSLARKATREEQQRYKAMKADRDSHIFADRYLRDYAEIQRLRKLSEKLAEIQQFLRPVSI
jgi:hypothetical protein